MSKWLWWFGIILVILSAIVWSQWPEAKVTIRVCNVGQGDAVVVARGLAEIVIDTGPPDGSAVACLGNILPFWDRKITAVVITHADSDHSGGLKTLDQKYSIQQVVTTATAYEDVKQMVQKPEIVTTSWQGDTWRFGSITGEVVWPAFAMAMAGKPATTSDSNDESLVWRMVYGKHSVWFAADVSCEVEQQLIAANLVKPSEYLKVGHHGAQSSSCEPFLTILQPQQAWISAGKNNRYNHPHRGTLERLESIAKVVKRTDIDGGFEIKWP